jgi:hypothetical protein
MNFPEGNQWLQSMDALVILMILFSGSLVFFKRHMSNTMLPGQYHYKAAIDPNWNLGQLTEASIDCRFE